MKPYLAKQWITGFGLTFLALSLSFVAGGVQAKEFTYTAKFGPVVSRTVFSPGDRPGHELVQAVRTDMTNSSDPDWNDVPVMNYSQSDLVDGSGTVSGYAIRTHKNGDKTYYRYQGKIKATAGGDTKDTTGEGTVDLVGGTGKFANIKGTGTYTSGGGVSTVKMKLE